MSLRIHDISRTIRQGTPVWPGDVEFRFSWTLRQDRGDSVNVGAFSSTIHLATHVDAPFHYDTQGLTTERLPLDAFVGPVRVVDVRGKFTIQCSDLAEWDWSGIPRVLLRTDAWPEGQPFPSEVPVLADDVPAYLGELGLRLFGIDVPSVDALDSRELPIHHGLGRAGLQILESVNLSSVEPGLYELVALPLRLDGADGSPVRAVLLSTTDD